MKKMWMRGLGLVLPLALAGPVFAENPQDRVNANAINADRSLPHNSAGDVVMGPSKIGSSLEPGDVSFIGTATLDGLAAYQLGELASARGSSPAVRQLGHEVMVEHWAGNHALRNAAESKGAIPPSTLPTAQATAISSLDRLEGPAFDRAVLLRLSAQLEQSMRTYQQQARFGADHELRRLSEARLPSLRDEHGRAQYLLDAGA